MLETCHLHIRSPNMPSGTGGVGNGEVSAHGLASCGQQRNGNGQDVAECSRVAHVGSDNFAFKAAWDAMTQFCATDCGN